MQNIIEDYMPGSGGLLPPSMRGQVHIFEGFFYAKTFQKSQEISIPNLLHYKLIGFATSQSASQGVEWSVIILPFTATLWICFLLL